MPSWPAYASAVHTHPVPAEKQQRKQPVGLRSGPWSHWWRTRPPQGAGKGDTQTRVHCSQVLFHTDGYLGKLKSFHQDQDKRSPMVSEISKEGLQIPLTKQLTMPCNY